MKKDKIMFTESGEEIIAYCAYCRNAIVKGEGYIYKPETDEYFHYDKTNTLNNCYFPRG